ncbi:SDR family NAD(P)-dependent oxidoreductase [Methylocystis echinoides]|uniref:Short-chain dehydrogenase n=1 Tax=Methylocystis echinoides TaxID=29468 RepID=A0A9W6GT78_9HYPH|nr:short-chain dehydrogenase [Methylocystis echinoides]
MTDLSNARPAAVITGASEGIGAELARVFAEKGHETAIVARRGDRLEALADEIAAKGARRPAVVELDLLAEGAVETLAARLADAGLSTQYLVNNAGFGLIGRIDELDQAEQLAMIDLNIRALTALTLRFMPSVTADKGGVLNVASVASFMPGPGFAVYYATKAFVRSFSEAIAEELKPAGVKVSCLCPGPVITGFQARAGMSFEGMMAAVKPALVPADEVARQGYEGLMAGQRVVIPGAVNKAMVWSARLSPRAVLLPLLGAAQMKRS